MDKLTHCYLKVLMSSNIIIFISPPTLKVLCGSWNHYCNTVETSSPLCSSSLGVGSVTNPEKKGLDPFPRKPVSVLLKEFLLRDPKNVKVLFFNPSKI